MSIKDATSFQVGGVHTDWECFLCSPICNWAWTIMTTTYTNKVS